MNKPKKKRKRYGEVFQIYFKKGQRQDLEDRLQQKITSPLVIQSLEKLSTDK